MEQEIWKDIKGYEGLYQVSNYGRVKRLYIKSASKETILKSAKNKSGYIRVCLSKNSKKSNKHIHRLVAETFIPNPNNYPQVNHKDENTSNNHVSNLEWCDGKYNTNYGTRNRKISSKLSKKISQFTLDGKLIKIWNSSIEIEKATGFDQSNICLCCLGKRKTVGGYKWKYMH